MDRQELVAAVRDNWHREWESAAPCRHLAGREIVHADGADPPA